MRVAADCDAAENERVMPWHEFCLLKRAKLEYMIYPLIERFKTAIKEQLTSQDVAVEARSVQYYAGLLLVHPNHLNAVVKKTTGEPAIRHIHQELINEAKLLLSETELSGKEIAYRLSFREPPHFYAFFRKHTQLTPNAYRQLCRTTIYRGEIATK